MYSASFIILYNDQQMHNYFPNYLTTTCSDTIVATPGSLQLIHCQVTQVFKTQLLVIKYILIVNCITNSRI